MGQATDQMNGTEAPEVHGYIVADDALERLERLVGIISEPLVVFTAELAGERDDALARAREAEAMSGRLAAALAALVNGWPQTSWAVSNDAHDTAVALLDEIGGEGATMSKTAASPIQENTTHVTSPPQRTDSTD